MLDRIRFPLVVFTVSVFAFMPLCLIGLRTFVSVDLNQAGYPYDAVSAEFVDRPTLQTDQVEWIPWLVDFWDEVRDGNFPLWTHSIAGGSPHGTMPYLGTLSPFNVGFAFLPDWYALNIGVALTFVAAQWGTWLMCRRWGVGTVAATIAGVLYAYTGTYLALVHRVTAIVLAPLIVWAFQRLTERPSGQRGAIAAGVLIWAWLTGFPSGFVYSAYLAALVVAWLTVEGAIQTRRAGWLPEAIRHAVKWRVIAGALTLLLGVTGSAITLWPFAAEALSRGALTERTWGGDDHMPTLNIFGLFDQAAIGDAVHGPWFAGWNPIETSSQIGFIGLISLAVFLGLAVVGRLPIPDRARPMWRLLCSTAVGTTVLVWIGGPLLWLAYRLPGLGSGPIQRLRYLLALAVAGLVALGIDAIWNGNALWDSGDDPDNDEESEERSSPRISSGLTLGFFVIVFGWHAQDYWELMNLWGQRRNVAVAVIVGLLATAVVGWAIIRARRAPHLREVFGALIAALVFVQAWYPFRDLTPQADPEWFYTETAAHEAVRAASDGRYRFLAPGATNFYPNGSQVQDLVDLRGVSIYDTGFKRVVEAASPQAFARDPFKITSTEQEWDWSSPMLDDLAVGVVALSPVGYEARTAESNESTAGHPFVSGYVPTAQTVGTRQPVKPLSSLSVAILRRGPCVDDRWRIVITADGRQVDTIEGWLVDVPESEFGATVRFPIDVGAQASTAPFFLDASMPFHEDCEASIGINDSRAIANGAGLSPASALTLFATDEAAVYRRPSAKELVWATANYRQVEDQTAALDLVGTGTTGVVGDVPTAQANRASAKVTDFALLDDQVTATVDADSRALVVVAQHLADGWSVTIDGDDADLVAVHGALTGVIVEAGQHDLDFRYEPSSFAWGWKLSLATLVLLVVLAVVNPEPPVHRPPSED